MKTNCKLRCKFCPLWQKQLGGVRRNHQHGAVRPCQDLPGVLRSVEGGVNLQFPVVNHQTVLIQHGEIPSIGGQGPDLLGDVQTGDLRPLVVHRHQTAHAAGLVSVQQQGGEIAPEQIFDAFKHEYIALDDPFEFKKIRVEDVNDKDCVTTIDFEYKKTPYHIEAKGNGPLDAVKTAINKEFDLDVRVMNYSEHALGSGSHARAAAYIEMGDNRTGKVLFGAGDSSNITKATIRAFFSGLNRLANK